MLKSLLLLFFSSYFAGIWVAALVWHSLSLPFSNPMELLAYSGELSPGYHPGNNVIRYLAVILLPSLFYFISFQFFKNRFLKDPPIFNSQENQKLTQWNQGLFIIFTLSVLYFFAKYIPHNHNPFSKMDHFHEGEVLSPAFKYLLNGQIWSGQLFAHGAFYDVLLPALSSYFFGDLSIAHFRISNQIQYQATRILFCFVLLYYLYKSIVPFSKQKYYFIVSSVFLFYLLMLDQYYFLERRDFFFLIGLTLILLSLQKNIFIFFTGLYVSIALMNSIDRGIYFTCLFFFLICFTLYQKNYKKFGTGVLGLILGFVMFYGAVGHQEFTAFLHNTFFILKIKDLNDAFVLHFPTRIGFGNFKNFIINISSFCLLITISLFLFNKNFLKKNWFIIGSIFTASSVIFLRSAIARSDDAHFAYVSVWTFIALFYWLSVITYTVFNKKIISIITSVFFILSISLIWNRIHSHYYFIAPVTEKKTFNELKNLPDTYFFEENKKIELQALLPSFQNESCIFNLSFNPSWPYHFKKPSCSYCYMPWFCSAKIKRQLVLGELEKQLPKVILMEYPLVGMQITMGEVVDYVLKNYKECSSRSLPEESRVRVYCKK